MTGTGGGHSCPTKWKCDGEILGVDMNTRQIATSDGDFYHLPDLKKKEARRKRYQRKMARQEKGSKRRKDTKKKLAR